MDYDQGITICTNCAKVIEESALTHNGAVDDGAGLRLADNDAYAKNRGHTSGKLRARMDTEDLRLVSLLFQSNNKPFAKQQQGKYIHSSHAGKFYSQNPQPIDSIPIVLGTL